MRVGIIGCGGISGVHLRSISEIKGSCLVAAADCVPEKAEKAAAQYGAHSYRDWEEMLEREELDVVHICTPHYLHTPMAVECLGRGIHVFTEKPPVISREQLACLEKAVRWKDHVCGEGLAAGASCEGNCVYEGNPAGEPRLGVCFQNRWNPEVQYAKELLESGALGKITGARGFVTWRREKSYYMDDWHGRMALEGGGALINQGIHTLDLLQYLVGERAEKVEAMQGNLHLKGEVEVEDTLCARIRYPEATAVLYVTNGYAEDAPPLLEIRCEEGRVRLEDGVLIIYRDGKATVKNFDRGEAYGKSYWGAGHQKAISHFYQSIESGESDLLDFQNVRDSLELLLRIYDSARGLRVDILP